MLKVNSKQHIRFVRVEQPTAWVVVAILLETRGNETVAISEPKVVKIIPKNSVAFTLKAGSAQKQKILALRSSKLQTISSRASLIISPYITALFGTANSSMIMGFAPMPPTF